MLKAKQVKSFWKTAKPFISNKNISFDRIIRVEDNDLLITAEQDAVLRHTRHLANCYLVIL